MDLKEIKLLIRLVDEKKFAEFELEKGDFKLRIKRGETPVIQSTAPSSNAASDPAPAASVSLLPQDPAGMAVASPTALPAVSLPGEKAETLPRTQLHFITSPIVGTFYRAPSPTAEPFVRIGDHVEPGTILCIVEAMKLMNEIPSDVAGEVVEILVENGQPVEYGQPLFGIKVSS